ncbi:DUF6708 domain-containing protein [Luteimonas salinilitoris]|uniref:DUF6708 domain-containing protein n=1 Tax=Luteimonas salinilitoris TaxID=3237697 RepID=A0ABV4HLJ2_9GAMM
MLTGWIKPFKIDRLLTADERRATLPHRRQPGVRPDPYDGLIHFNSSYADFIDRSFRLRGMVNAALGLIVLIFYIGFYFWLISNFPEEFSDPFVSVFMTFSVVFLLAVTWIFYYKKELFSYTHYPVRFNRKTGKVHVFRHNGSGGVLTVPWDQVYWHVGRGYQQKFLCDVRATCWKGTWCAIRSPSGTISTTAG